VTTKELLDGWEHLITDDLRFLGSRNMTESQVLGKAGLVPVMTHFYKLSAPCALKTRFR
jgi:hypothetical protein